MIDDIASKPNLFTIGHSDHELPDLIATLAKHEVNAVADVRSHPYSRFHGQFNRETLTECLNLAGIEYVFLGRELGARRWERECYHNQQAKYDLIKRLPAFQEGLKRLRDGLTTHRIALLCAEKDPIICHRTILICRHLRTEDINIRHIREDGSVETNEQAEARLIEAVGLPPTHLFLSRDELIEMAYDLQAERIAYSEADTSPMTSGGAA